MRRLRAGLATAALALLAAPALSATWSWQRELEFAKALTTRQYYDIADLVIDRLQGKASIIGIEKAFLYRELGEYYSDLAQTVVTEKRDVAAFIKYLDLARSYFLKFLNHPSIANNPRYVSTRFDIRLRLSRIQLAVAEGHARSLDDDRVSDAEKGKHKKAAIDIFKAAVGEFQKAVAEKGREVAKVKGLAPPANADAKLRAAYKTKYRETREEHFRVRLELNMARVRFAELLKKVTAPGGEAASQLDAAEKDYRQLLLDFSGTPGATQANLELARCLMAKGPKFDKEALERLSEVWEKRINFGQFKRVPCEAGQLRATILLRQKRGKDLIETCDAILEFASEVWKADQKSIQTVINTFGAVPESDREQFDQRAVTQIFMMEAEGYALEGELAEKAKKPRRDIRRLYSAAYDIALGVLEVRRFLDPKYSALVEKWRVKANREVAPAIVRQRYIDAINKRKFDVAAALYREIASGQTLLPRDKLTPSQKREMWYTVGQCYHAAGLEYEAAIAFLAAGRWFPEPSSEAYKAANAAIAAASSQFKKTKDPNDEKFLRWIQLQAEALNPYGGKGGIYVQQAEVARNEGRYDRALTLLDLVKPDQEAYPHALYHKALTYKAKFRALKPDEQKGLAGRRDIAGMKAAYGELFDTYRTKVPELKDKGDAAAVERLVNVVGAAVAMYTDFYLRDPVKDPKVVLDLTNDLAKRFPGIDKTAGYPVIIFSRMRAAYTLIGGADSAAGAKLLAIVEETWKTLGTFPDFRYLDKAAAMAAQSNNVVAKACDTEAKAVADKAAKDRLTALAEKYRATAIEYYLQLIEIAPRQTLRTYRYILYSLKTRDHTPKSEDYRRIVEIAPKIIDLFKRNRQAEEDLLFVQAALGIAYAELGKHREAIAPLEAVDDVYEKRYQDDYLPYRVAKRKYDEDPERNPKPGRPPRRAAAQPEVMEQLALCYLQAKASDKYERALRTYITLTRLYQSQPEKYWTAFYNLCVTYQRLGQYEDAVKQIDRAWLRSPTLGNRKSQFRDLVAAIQASVTRLEDAARKAALEPEIQRLLDNLRK